MKLSVKIALFGLLGLSLSLGAMEPVLPAFPTATQDTVANGLPGLGPAEPHNQSLRLELDENEGFTLLEADQPATDDTITDYRQILSRELYEQMSEFFWGPNRKNPEHDYRAKLTAYLIKQQMKKNGGTLPFTESKNDMTYISPDGKIYADCSSKNVVKICDTHSGACLQTIETGNDIYILKINTNNSTFAIVNNVIRAIQIWDIQSGKCVQILPFTRFITSLALHESMLAVSSFYNINIWDTNSGTCATVINHQLHEPLIQSLAFHPNGSILASGSNKNIKLWDIKSGKCVQTLPGHKGPIYALTFNANGSSLISGSDDEDKTIKIWDFYSGNCLETLTGHSPFSLALTADESQLISKSYDTVSSRIFQLFDKEDRRTIMQTIDDDLIEEITGNHKSSRTCEIM